MGITMSKSSAFSIKIPFIFEIQEINGALFFKASFLSSALLLASLFTPFVTVIFPFTKIYASK